MDRRNKSPLPWLSALTTEPFYLFHSLLFFSYLSLRHSASPSLSPEFSSRLLRGEAQAVLALLVFGAVKLVRDETWEGYISHILLSAKVLLIGLATLWDYHLAFFYLMGFLVVTILTQQPDYPESGNSCQLTPLQLETILTEASTSRYWLVEFCTSWSSRCRHGSRSFADLSITYSNQIISFGTVDLGLFPNVADKFGISLDASASQLPTYILFDGAVEVARFPDLDTGHGLLSPAITKSQLCKHFELDRRLIEYMSSK